MGDRISDEKPQAIAFYMGPIENEVEVRVGIKIWVEEFFGDNLKPELREPAEALLLLLHDVPSGRLEILLRLITTIQRHSECGAKLKHSLLGRAGASQKDSK